jgi:uncharacterized protein (TIGR03435 family)
MFTVRGIVTASFLLFTLAAEQPRAFDAASLKPVEPGSVAPGFPDHPDFGGRKGGRYTRWRISLRLLIQMAYQLSPDQISGPAWIDSQRYNLVAAMPPATTDGQLLGMLQTLLAERFHLKLRRETREQPAYALILGDTRANLKRSDDQSDEEATRRVTFLPAGLDARRKSMRDLAAILMRWTDRPVVDRTGLTGLYDFQLDWSSGPSDALQSVRRVGLKVEPRRLPIEHATVEHADRVPAQN